MTAPAARSRVADVRGDRLAALNRGTIEAATLTECLAVDFGALLKAVLPGLPAGSLTRMEQAASEGISRRMALAGRLIHAHGGLDAADALRHHASDTVRGWACFGIAAEPSLTLPARLARIRPYADDHHFGVREWSWMAVRPQLAADLARALALLTTWTTEPSERLRRFASEATRPRGVWCAHLRDLRAQPAKALPLLEPLSADPSAYVQDSVGNWLNDAGKDRPEWVSDLCARWIAASPSAATARICKRALRSIKAAK